MFVHTAPYDVTGKIWPCEMIHSIELFLLRSYDLDVLRNVDSFKIWNDKNFLRSEYDGVWDFYNSRLARGPREVWKHMMCKL